MSNTRIWICPSLCGCEIELTAQWVGQDYTDVLGRTVSYQHPTPFTITKLSIINCCVTHDSLKTLGVDTDPYPDRPGYLKRPIPNASEAESLYVHLYSCRGQTWCVDTCGCTIYEVVENSLIQPTKHPIHTDKCEYHFNDDDVHTQAIADHMIKNQAVNAIMEAYPTLTPSDVQWNFDDKRSLSIDVPSIADKSAIQNALSNKAVSNVKVG